MKKIILVFISILTLSSYIFAHGGNISGWKDKDSNKIVSHDGKYYGYHNKDGVRHYHEVKWNDKSNRWDIVESSIYYDKDFNVTTLEELSKNNKETEKVIVKFNEGVDGDTAKFDMNGEIIKVRFLAVDTPESVHPTKEVQAYGVEASNFTKEKLKNAKTIELEFDNNSDKTDKYGRYLAWIWVDGELLQDLLVKEGLAKVEYLYADYKYTNILEESEKIAKETKIGIWKDEASNEYSEKENFVDVEEIENNSIQPNEKQKDANYIEEISLTLVLIVIAVIVKFIKRKQ